MTEPDFTGVDPLRLAEARRRIAILEEYLDLDRPSVSDATDHAKKIGVNRSQFYTLAKAWRLHRDPSLLGLNKGYSASRDYGIDMRAQTILNEELQSAGELGPLVAAVNNRCAAERIAPPSPQTIRDRFRERQVISPRLEGPRRVLVSRMWFHLPVVGQEANAMPILLSATLLPERFIVAHELALNPAEPPSVSTLLRHLDSLTSSGAHKRGLLIDRIDRRDARELLKEMGFDAERGWKGSVQREASRQFAGRLGKLEAIFQRGSARPGARRNRHKVGELDSEQASRIIERAIALNNRRTSTKAPTFDMRAG